MSWPDSTTIAPARVCRQGSDAETDRRYKTLESNLSLSGYGGEIRRQSESHHIDEAGRFPSMGKGFGDHRVGQHHEDSAPGKHIDERLGGIGNIFEHNKTRQ